MSSFISSCAVSNALYVLCYVSHLSRLSLQFYKMKRIRALSVSFVTSSLEARAVSALVEAVNASREQATLPMEG